MKRIFGIIFVLIVLAAFTPLGCFAEDDPIPLTCDDFQPSGTCSLNGNLFTLNGEVTLDLNGNRLSSQGGITCFSTSPCSLTITDNSAGNKGTLTVGSIDIAGFLEINGGTVNASSIYAREGITIEKDGTVEKASGGQYGIFAGGSITISGTVENATGTNGTGIYAGGSITIESGGTVNASGGQYGIYTDGVITISGTVEKATGTKLYGIYARDGITIEKDGTVTEAYGGYYGISARDITIKDGGTVENATGDQYGISAGGGITIYGTVTEATGGKYYGIYADGDITIDNGTVTATGTNGTGIYADGDITISGTVTATGGDFGISAAGSITIESGGTVTATATGTNGSGIISASRDISVSGGTVTASGDQSGISAGGGITISDGGKVEATGTSGLGIYTVGSITISGGSVEQASGGDYGIFAGSITISDGGMVKDASGSQYGIYAGSGGIIISGGTVKAFGGDSGIYTDSRDITISGENTQVTATATGTNGSGINAHNDISISGGTVTASGSQYGIYAVGNITIENDNRVNATGESDAGIYADGWVIISGGTVEKASGGKYGIYADSASGISISGGMVKDASGGIYGIYAGSITISGENTQVTAKSTGTDGSGIHAAGSGGISISGGTMEASGGNYGIHAEKGSITIEKGGTVTAAGETQAVSGIVKNAVPGIGWTDSAGTQGKELIKLPDVPESGQSLTSYKQVRFPASTAAVTFKVVNGAWNDGARGEKTETLYCAQGDDLKLAQNQIPTVGSNPDSGFITGSWNQTPTSETVFTENTTTTFTYTYAEKTTAVVDPSPADPGLTYNGKAQELVTAGKASGGTMQYALGTDTAPTGVWGTAIPTGTKADTYYVWYKAVGDTDHYDSTPAKVTAVIGPKSITGAAVTLDKTQMTYNGSEQRVSVTGVTIDGLSLTADDFTVSGNTGTDKGDYEVTVTGTGYFKETATAKWSIVEKAMTVSTENVTVPYDGQPHRITVTVTDPSDGAVVTYGKAEGTYDLAESPAITNVSESPLMVYFKVTAANYTDYTGSAIVTITAKELRTFTIRYDANGGTGTMAEQAVTEGAAASLTANSFTREHHTFTGWNTKADGSGTAYADKASVTLSADLELFAQWKEADKIIDTDQPALTEVPKELQEKYTSVSALQNALIFELKVNGEPVRIEQTVFVDVVLKVSFDGGEHWEIATPDNFPAGGMEVRLDYPEGTGKDTHQFSVSHMFTVGEKAGQMEYPKVDAKDDGLYVWLTGLSPVAIAWREIETPKETMKVPVEIDSVLKNSGSRGLPDEIREMEVTLTVTLKDGDTEVKTTEPLKLKLTKDSVTPMQDAEFEKVLEGLAPGKQSVTVSVSPKTVFGRDKIYSSEGPVEGPVKWKYELSAKGELNEKNGKIIVRIYLFWDNGSRPEEVRVVALPEDEIGAYKLRDDGTKEYLLFQTYDICMAWLGSDELCRGPERCYHK